MLRLMPKGLAHLRRMTDPRGLIRNANGDCPDRFSGYSTLDNADALRLCAMMSHDRQCFETVNILAKTFFGYLSRGWRADGGVHCFCDATGEWSEEGDDSLVQSRVGRALGAVSVSELPNTIKLAAGDWWRMMIDDLSGAAWQPTAAANWLIGIGQLDTVDQRRDLDRVKRLSNWLIEDCYYPIRTSEWEWFELQWSPMAAVLPTGLWFAYEMLGEKRQRQVAETTTNFVIENLFQEGLLMPVGTHGGWARHGNKATYDQSPREVLSVVELLCKAYEVTGQAHYAQHAEYAAAWFTGNNCRDVTLINAQTGACHNALTANGLCGNQGSAATLSYLLTQAILQRAETEKSQTTEVAFSDLFHVGTQETKPAETYWG